MTETCHDSCLMTVGRKMMDQV